MPVYVPRDNAIWLLSHLEAARCSASIQRRLGAHIFADPCRIAEAWVLSRSERGLLASMETPGPQHLLLAAADGIAIRMERASHSWLSAELTALYGFATQVTGIEPALQACPCCHYHTFDAIQPVGEACLVCGWVWSGPQSLTVAQHYFAQMGACHPALLDDLIEDRMHRYRLPDW